MLKWVHYSRILNMSWWDIKAMPKREFEILLMVHGVANQKEAEEIAMRGG